jgi:predicted porin
MKKSAVCGAAIALGVVSLPASAQSSVTLFGLLDAGITFTNNAGGSRSLMAQDSVWTPSVWGLRGTEDLGGGYKAVFELMSQFSINSGAQIPGAGALFNREAYVGIEKTGIGRLTFGQQYNLMADFLFFPPTALDGTFTYGGLFNMRQGPFTGLGIPGNPTGALDFDQIAGTSRVSNSVKFTSEPFYGFRVGALYGFGNQAGSFSSDNTVGLAADYQIQNFRIGAAYNETRYAELNNGHDGIRNFGVGAGYRLGALDATALYTNTRNTLTGGGVQVFQVGGLYAFNPVLRLGANYQFMSGNAQLEHNKASQVTTALQYSLSKRTTLYGEMAYQWTHGDVPGQYNAWIGGVDPSSNNGQFVGRLGMQTSF